MVSSTAFHETTIVAHLRLIMVIEFGHFLFSCLRFLLAIEAVHSTQCQKLSSRKCAPRSINQASPSAVKSQSVGMTFLVWIFHRKVVSKLVTLVRNSISSLVGFAMLSFSLELCIVMHHLEIKVFDGNDLRCQQVYQVLELKLESTEIELKLIARSEA